MHPHMYVGVHVVTFNCFFPCFFPSLHTSHAYSDTALSDEITSTIFYNKIRRTLGLDRCHFAVTGATRLPLSLYGKGFFITKDMALREIFGMSETTG